MVWASNTNSFKNIQFWMNHEDWGCWLESPLFFVNFFDIEKLIKIPWYYKSMKDIYLVLCVLLALHETVSLNCNATNFHFTSKYTLGKQDELNKTFAKIQ